MDLGYCTPPSLDSPLMANWICDGSIPNTSIKNLILQLTQPKVVRAKRGSRLGPDLPCTNTLGLIRQPCEQAGGLTINIV